MREISPHMILFGITPLTYYGGFEKNIADLAVAFCESGTNVEIITCHQYLNDLICLVLRGHRLEKRISEQGVRNKIAGIPEVKIRMRDLFPMSPGFREMRKRFKAADIVYLKNEMPELIIAKYMLWLQKKPALICGVHTPLYYEYSDSLVSKMHNSMYKSTCYRRLLSGTFVHALNKKDAQHLQDILAIRSDRIKIIPNGIDISEFKPLAEDMDSERLLVLFAGRLTEQKGLDILKEAIYLLRNEEVFPEIEFLIAGTGELQPLANRLSDEFDNVRYLGHVDAMKNLYNQVDALAVPSRWEGLPYSCLEAQSCGLPVIGSNIPGIRDIIIDERTGILIRPEDPESLKDGILALFEMKRNQKEGIRTMRKAARKNIEENYSKEIIFSRMSDMFLESLERVAGE
jgi:glycosyltransferase involved in cell wall biosynthesis